MPEEYLRLDDIIAEQNRLMNGEPFVFTEEEWAQHSLEMSAVIKRDKERRV
jgi:hypothetical protein